MTFWIRTHQQTLIKVLGSLLALGSLFFLLEQQSWHDVLDAAQQISREHLTEIVILMFISRFFTVGRWYVLLRSAGIPIHCGEATSITFTGLFASNFLPTTIGGDVARIGGVIQAGYDPSISTASVIVDRLVSMFGMGMVLPVGLLSFTQWYPAHSEIFLSFSTLAGWREGTSRFLKKIGRALKVWVNKPFALLVSLFFSWGHMLCVFSILQIAASGLGKEIPYWEIAGLWSLAYFITLIPISVNGYGLQELSLTFLLSNVAGIPIENSLVIALLLRGAFILASLPGAFFLPSVMSSMKKA